MRGIDANTGKALSGLDHLSQSIRDILTTPIGSRIMLRDYGSRLFEFTDAPINQKTIMEIYSATVEALQKWEPRIKVTHVLAKVIESGRIVIGLEAKYRETGEVVIIGGIEI